MGERHAVGLVVFRIFKGSPEFLLINDTFSPKHVAELDLLDDDDDEFGRGVGRRRDRWEPLKGYHMGAEDDTRCALREASETAGLRGSDLRLEPDFVREISYLDSQSRLKRVVYYLAQASDQARVVPGVEGIQCHWASPAVAFERVGYRNIQEVLKSALEIASTRAPMSRGRDGFSQSGGDADQPRARRSERAAAGGSGAGAGTHGGAVGSGARRSWSGSNGAAPASSAHAGRGAAYAAPLRSAEKSIAPASGPSADNPLYKTRLCERFEKHGECPYGARCTYAHGEADLRETNPLGLSAAQVNPNYKTRLCERFMSEGICQFGPKCTFAHGPEELRSRTAVPVLSTPAAVAHKGAAAAAAAAPVATAPVLVPHITPGVTRKPPEALAAATSAATPAGPPASQPAKAATAPAAAAAPATAASAPAATAPPPSAPQPAPPTAASAPPRKRGQDDAGKISLTDLRAQIADVAAEAPAPSTDRVKQEEALQKEFASLFAEQRGTQEELRGILRREAQHNLTKQQLFNVLMPALLTARADSAAALKERLPLLKRFMVTAQDQTMLLRALERMFARAGEAATAVRPHVLPVCKLLYDADVVEEDKFIKWSEAAQDGAFKTAVQPFIKWLQTAEEED